MLSVSSIAKDVKNCRSYMVIMFPFFIWKRDQTFTFLLFVCKWGCSLAMVINRFPHRFHLLILGILLTSLYSLYPSYYHCHLFQPFFHQIVSFTITNSENFFFLAPIIFVFHFISFCRILFFRWIFLLFSQTLPPFRPSLLYYLPSISVIPYIFQIGERQNRGKVKLLL